MAKENITQLSIAELKKRLAQLEQNSLTQAADFANELATDQRLGVQQLVHSFQKRQTKVAQAQADFVRRLGFEKEAWAQGRPLVAGIDEVGRGPLAGPVVAAAVILPHDFNLYEVNDSKQLSLKKREHLAPLILEQAVAVGIGVVDNQTIDTINIYEAARQAMSSAVNDLGLLPDQLLIDAMELDTKISQKKLIKGDARSVSIGAASIIAKTTRDQLMADYAKDYPGYGFEKNAGYGTKEHLFGIEQFGITPLHRRSFEPIKSYLKN